jgi:hypothetical protein
MSRRTSQQDTGDELEQEALRLAQEFFEDACLTKGSGCVNQDGDVANVPSLHVECKNSIKPGKGRSISKADWTSIKAKARKRVQVPIHLGFDDDREVVALIPWSDLLGFLAQLEEES